MYQNKGMAGLGCFGLAWLDMHLGGLGFVLVLFGFQTEKYYLGRLSNPNCWLSVVVVSCATNITGC